MSRIPLLLAFSALLHGCAAGGDATTTPFAESTPNRPTAGPDPGGDTGGSDDDSGDGSGGVSGGPVPEDSTGTTAAPDPEDSTSSPGPGECGDGVVDPDEDCDDGNLVDTDTCTSACKPAACGDGHVQPGEQCDDGDLVPGDGCEPGCELPSCGDGVVQPGEQCDDGNAVETDTCTSLCKKPTCGDGFLHAGEQCDDGNGITTDACVDCKPAVCGDGHVFQGNEPCDDGNAVATDACIDCKPAQCGDGHLWYGVEDCDGGAVPHGKCSQCKLVCDAPWADCDDQGATGCETDLSTNSANCGMCGNSCGKACLNGKCAVEYGPKHSFVGFTSELYVTQGCCSVGCAGDTAVDAAYFCSHFYGPACVPKPGYVQIATPLDPPKMHKFGGCSQLGIDIPNTQCDGGPCKMLTFPVQTVALTKLVCQCP